jgi:3-deoxy-manno-octulosonate cytidylyltransferase (CMP-KDO synthetase)
VADPASPPPAPIVIIIPARLASTRFPGKVLADRTGKPLIQHVWESASRARCTNRVVIATDDARVQAAAATFAAECIMTREDHPNGTSRLAEAAAKLRLPADAIVVNAQGDEPDLDATLIDAAVEVLQRSGAPVSTVATPFRQKAGEQPNDPHIVKVVLAGDGSALYFSRARIPFVRDAAADNPVQPLRHVGLYVYRRSFLDQYARLAPTDLERTEQLEQLRILFHGFRISVAVRETTGSGGIDTPEQYEAFVARWRSMQP